MSGSRRHPASTLTLIGCAGLAGFYTLRSLWLGPGAPNLTLWLLQLLPLGLTLPGLLQGSSRSHQWLCFLMLAYFIKGVLNAFAPGQLLPGLLEIGLCLLVFSSAIVFVQRTRRQAAARAPEHREARTP